MRRRLLLFFFFFLTPLPPTTTTTDLVPREVAEQWLKHLRNELPTIAFKASTQSQRNNISHAGDGLGNSGSSAAQGAGVLLSLLGNYCRNMGMKTAIRVGIVGVLVDADGKWHSLPQARLAPFFVSFASLHLRLVTPLRPPPPHATPPPARLLQATPTWARAASSTR